jgi:hydroxysqualene synthase
MSSAPSTIAHGVDHYENFPVASWLTPARLRPAIVAIYWFARVADDIADEGNASAQQRLADLAAYRADLMVCLQERASDRWPQVFTPLARAIREHSLPLNLLDDLLQAFEQDVRYTADARWYADDAELLDYCRRSANPIGRLLLHLYGVKHEDALQASDAICSALQLINFWQDLSRDIPRGRFYLPLDAMQAHGFTQEAIMARVDTAYTATFLTGRTARAVMLMGQGMRLPALIRQTIRGFDGWRLALELRCVIEGGLRILEKIDLLNHQVLSQRPKISKWDAVVIVWRALTR